MDLPPVDELVGLLSGQGASRAIIMLQAGQRSRNLILLRGLLDLVDEKASEDGVIAQIDRNYSAMCDVEAAAPDLVARLLAGPHFGLWVVACLRRLLGRDVTATQPLWVDLAHLGALVISFAVAADVEAEATVPARSGRLVIPGTGCVFVDGASEWELTTIRRHRDGTLVIRQSAHTISVPPDPPADFGRWQDVRYLRGSYEGQQIAVELDDLDPYRDCYGLRPASRLAEGEVARWRDQFARAWSVLAQRHRENAAAAAAVLRTVIPLRTRQVGSGVSATLRYATGAVSLTPQMDGLRLARTLVHELHHIKLNLLMDLLPLYRTGNDELFYSPWRDDPRPLSGLMHGVFAGIGVSGFWRTECNGPDSGVLSQFELARIRRQVEIGLPVLARSTRFTSAGMALIAVMETTVGSWHLEPPGGYLAVLADDLVFDHLVRWRLRNLVSHSGDIWHLATDWSRGRSPSLIPRVTLVPGRRESFAEDARLRLAHRTLADRVSTARETSRSWASRADHDLINCDYAAAAAAYQAEIDSGTATQDSWAGLAVSRRRLLGDVYDPLVARPELVLALHAHLSADPAHAPSLVELVGWLRPVCRDERESAAAGPAGVRLPVTSLAPRNRIPPGGYAPR